MPRTIKEISFKGQNIYVGIDTHLRNWAVTILTENNFNKKLLPKIDAGDTSRKPLNRPKGALRTERSELTPDKE